MGEYEPHDSRLITLKDERAPGEPPRTGPREGETRQQQQSETELDEDQRGDDAEQVPDGAALREEAMERDAEELGDRDG
jgi:hypothetical protein